MKKVYSTAKAKHILVVGARFGSDVILLKEGGYDCKITAIDLHDPPLDDTVSFADAHDLSFIEKDIDIVWAYNVFEHFIKPSTVIKEIKKHSKECVVVVSVPNFEVDEDPYDAQEEFENIGDFKNMFIKNGFKEIFYKSYFIGKRKVPQYWLIFKRVKFEK